MLDYDGMDLALTTVRNQWPNLNAQAGIILGSGWGDSVEFFTVRDRIDYVDLGLGRPGVSGHVGRLLWTEANGREALVFQGRRHYYEGEGWTPVALPVYVLSQLRIRFLILTNAAGGMKDGFHPGELMIIDDHINGMHDHPLIGPHRDCWGPRFPDQSCVYDPDIRACLDAAGTRMGRSLEHGVYLAVAGPSYETPAEIRAFRTWGADVIGMSTVPEAMLGHASGMRVAALSCITNCASKIKAGKLSHQEVTATVQQTMPTMKALLQAFWEELARVG